MVSYLDVFWGKKVEGFSYNKPRRIVRVSFRGTEFKLYVDLTHPFTSFFVRKENLPVFFEKKDVSLEGMPLIKIRVVEDDRIFYLVFKKKDDIRVLGVELTGKASYVLVIDNDGRVIYKYPPHRKRKRGGDVGNLYEMVKKNIEPPLSKYFRDVLPGMNNDEIIKLFKNTDVFYTNGKVISPRRLDGFKPCGDFSDCFFSQYVEERFSIPSYWLKYFDESIPSYVYFRAAGLLQNGLIRLSDNLRVGNYRIAIPPGLGEKEVINYFLLLGKLTEDGKLQSSGEDKSNTVLYSPSGFKISIGRSAKENNRLTFNMAKGEDIFFHVRDYPGSHVILHSAGAPVREDDILYCARLAKYHSKAKGLDKVEVIYTKVKYVRPVKGNVGKVIYSKERSVRV